MPRIGSRKVAICAATGEKVVMEYEGKRYGDPHGENGQPYWLCLHNEDPRDDRCEVKEFIEGVHQARKNKKRS